MTAAHLNKEKEKEMKKNMLVSAAVLLVAGAAQASLVTGASQRYAGSDYNFTSGVWDDTGTQNADATTTTTAAFTSTTTASGATAVQNSTAGAVIDFARTAALGSTTGQATIQAVIRMDGNLEDRSGPIGISQDNGWSGLYMGANLDGSNAIRGGNVGNTGSGNDALNTSGGASVTSDWGVYTLVVDASQNTGPQLTATFAYLTDLDTDVFTVTYSSANNSTAATIGLGLEGALFSGEYNQEPTEGWNGAIADIVIYDSALSSTDLETNKTEFYNTYQIPEPATLGLIAAFGGGLLFVRRRFSM
jgi:hypothetical protein